MLPAEKVRLPKAGLSVLHLKKAEAPSLAEAQVKVGQNLSIVAPASPLAEVLVRRDVRVLYRVEADNAFPWPKQLGQLSS